MAEEAPLHSPAGNGERLSLQLGTKAVGIQARDLIPVLLLLGGLLGGYLIYSGVQDSIKFLYQQQVKILELLHTHQVEVSAIRLEQRAQNDEQLDTIRRMLLTMLYNLGHPEQQLPLEVLPTQPAPR